MLDHCVSKINLSESLSLRDFKSRKSRRRRRRRHRLRGRRRRRCRQFGSRVLLRPL